MFVFIPPISPQFPATRHACGRTEPARKKESVQGEQGQVEQQNRTDLHRYAQARMHRRVHRHTKI